MAREPHDRELRHLRLIRRKPSAERGLGHEHATALFCTRVATLATPCRSHRLASSSRLAGLHVSAARSSTLIAVFGLGHCLRTRVGLFTWVSEAEEGTRGKGTVEPHAAMIAPSHRYPGTWGGYLREARSSPGQHRPPDSDSPCSSMAAPARRRSSRCAVLRGP